MTCLASSAVSTVTVDSGTPTCPTGQHWDDSQGKCVTDAVPTAGMPWWIWILLAGATVTVVFVAQK